MKLIKSSIWSVISVGIRSVIIFLINKLFAINYGPHGITLLAHFQNLLSIFLTVPNDGVNKGVIKYVADATLKKNHYYPIINAGLVLNFFIFLISVIGILILKNFFENPFVGTNNFWLGIVFFFAFLQLLNLLGLSIILASEKLILFVVLQVLGNIFSLLFTFILIQMASYQEALIGLAAGPGATLIFTLTVLVWKEKVALKKVVILPSKEYLGRLAEFILMALSIVIFSKAVDFMIRQYAINEFPVDETGFWQSVVRVSDLYLMAFVAILSMVYYPKVSNIINIESRLKHFVRSFFWKVSGLSILFLCGIYLLRVQILILVFDPNFIHAQFLFPFQLTGDLFKISSWILSFLLLAQSRTKLFIASQFIFAIFFVTITYFLSSLNGIEGFPQAYALKNFVYLLFVFWIYRKLIF